MPRTFSTAVKGQLNNRFGTEPMLILGVEWAEGAEVLYSDRKLNGGEYPYPLLIEIGQFDTTTIVSGGGDSRSVSVTLNDIDGSLRTIIDEHDVLLHKARVYLGFQGLPASERALMFEGQIQSPLVWDEAARTLTFDIVSTIESREAGFTMDDGDFPFVPPAQRNQPWPLIFGQVCNMEAVHVTTLQKGILAEGQGVKDPTLEERLCQARKLQCPDSTAEGISAPFRGVSKNPDLQCLNRRHTEICRILHEIEQQESHVKSEITIRGGDDFPQNQEITIRIGDVKFDGVMVGETFTISQVYHPDLEDIDNPPCKDIKDSSFGLRARADRGFGTGSSEVAGRLVGGSSTTDCDAGPQIIDETVVGGSHESWEYFNQFKKGKFIWLPPGSEVVLNDDSEQIYIVSLTPGTVDQVAAYKQFEDTSLLTEVPTEFYTVHNSDFGDYQVVELRFARPLSSEEGEWEDTIYVSFTSDVGPNPVDTIEWLVDKYTDFDIDSTSFASVKSSLTNYPSNFWVKSRPDVLSLIRDIAYQVRCGVFIRDNTVHLVYLSKEPISVKTLTESDLLLNTFRVSHTETDDLVTKHSISWRETEAEIYEDTETELSFSLKLNIPRYGLLQQDYDFYTQNTFSTVEKSATFWMIRKANIWKQVEFETPVKHLDLDVFDCVTLDIEQFPTTKCVVLETQYNADTNSIRFKCWTPILAGTSVPYTWAWPALQSGTLEFNPDTLGDGTNSGVTPPEGHPLRSGYNADTARLATAGDRFPSDLDDTFPLVECRVATGAEIEPSDEPVWDELAEANFRDALRQADTYNIENDDEDDDNQKEESDGCGQNSSNVCLYEVKIPYVIPETLTTVQGPFDTCRAGAPCLSGAVGGRPCTGQIVEKCHQFPSRQAALDFIQKMKQEAAHLLENCLYNAGQEDPYQVGTPGVNVINPPPPEPPKNEFDVTYATPIDCGQDTKGFADPDLAGEEANDAAEEGGGL